MKNGRKPTISCLRKLFPALAFFLIACGDSRQDEAVRFFERANFLVTRREYGEAIEFYTEAIQKKPDFADAYNNRGLARQRLNQWREAKADFDAALAQDAEYHEAYYNRARAHFELGRAAAGLADLQKIEEAYRDSAFFHVTRADLLTLSQDRSAAYAAYGRALQLQPRNVEAHVNRGVLYFQDRRYPEARRDFEQALLLDSRQHFALNNLALIEARDERYPEALRRIDRAIALKPGQAFYINNRGYILLQMNRLAEGLAAVESALRLDDQNGWAYRNRGIHALKVSQPARALADFQKAQSLEPGIEDLSYYLGAAYFQRQDVVKACQSWQRGAQLNEARSKKMADQYCRR